MAVVTDQREYITGMEAKADFVGTFIAVVILQFIFAVVNYDEFYLLFEQKTEFRPKFRISGCTCLCQHETSHTFCYTCKEPKSNNFSD